MTDDVVGQQVFDVESPRGSFKAAVSNTLTPPEHAFMEGYKRENLTSSAVVEAVNSFLASPSSNADVKKAMEEVMAHPAKFYLHVKEHNVIEQKLFGTPPITVHAPAQPKSPPAPRNTKSG